MFCVRFVILCIGILLLDRKNIIDLSQKYIGYTLFSLPVLWNYAIPIIIFKESSCSKFYKIYNNYEFIITMFVYLIIIIYTFLRLNFNIKSTYSNENNRNKKYTIKILKQYLIILIIVFYIPLIILLISSYSSMINSNIFLFAFIISSNIEILFMVCNIFIIKSNIE